MNLFRKPYPSPTNSSPWISAVPIGLFIALFLILFQPFGLSSISNPNKYPFMAGYGLVTFVVLSVDHYLLKSLLRRKAVWTVGKHILWLAFILFTIGAGNFFYSASALRFHSPLDGFLIFQFFTLAVGIIPVTVTILLTENIRNKQYLQEATELNLSLTELHPLEAAPSQTLTLTAENNKEKIQIPSNDFLYAESTGNYIQVSCLKDGKLKSILLRLTLTKAEEQLRPYSFIIKCHRAFLVNTDQVVQVKGNAQGLRLQLRHTDVEIAVSRSFTKVLKEKIEG
jgi:DNA-binding LytR/AlgR family response regulator